MKKLTNRQEKMLAKKAENFCRLRMVLLAMLMRFVKQVDDMQLVERVLDILNFNMLTKQLGEVYEVVQATKPGGSLRVFHKTKTRSNLWARFPEDQRYSRLVDKIDEEGLMLYELFSYLTYYNSTYFKKFDFELSNLERDQPDVYKFFESRMHNVELVRNKVERIYFVRPRACDIYVASSSLYSFTMTELMK